MTRPTSDELLPGVFRRAAGAGSPLRALCAAMEHLLTPAEAALEDIDAWFDPYRAPDVFVPHLARWVGLGHLLTANATGAADFAPGIGRLRVLVANAAELAQARGTPAGLVRLLSLATGLGGFAVSERRPAHIVVHLPDGRVDRGLVEQIVEADRPAYVTFEIDEPAPARSLPPPQS